MVSDDEQRRVKLIGLRNLRSVYLASTHPDALAARSDLSDAKKAELGVYHEYLKTLLESADFAPLIHVLPKPVFAEQPKTEGMTTI